MEHLTLTAEYDVNVKTPDNYSMVNTKDFNKIPEEFLEDLDISFLNNVIGVHLITVAENYCPTCVVWDYCDDNLLPGRINLSQFSADPTICIPLKNMFSLARCIVSPVV